MTREECGRGAKRVETLLQGNCEELASLVELRSAGTAKAEATANANAEAEAKAEATAKGREGEGK